MYTYVARQPLERPELLIDLPFAHSKRQHTPSFEWTIHTGSAQGGERMCNIALSIDAGQVLLHASIAMAIAAS